MAGSVKDALSSLASAVGAAAPPARITDILSELLSSIEASDAAGLKALQREAEDAVLQLVLNAPGSGAPARALAGASLSALFTRGNSIAVFSRVSELTAALTVKGVAKKAPAAVRLGGLECLTALANSLRATLSGSYARILTDVVPLHGGASEPSVRCAALALLSACLENSAQLPIAAQEASLKLLRTLKDDRAAPVRAACARALRALCSGGDGVHLFLGDRGQKGDVLLEALAAATASLKDGDKLVREAAGAALGAAVAASMLPPAAAALTAAKADARRQLQRALQSPVTDNMVSAFAAAKSRPVRAAVAEAWVILLAGVAGRLEEERACATAAAPLAALREMLAVPGRPGAGRDELHAAACCLYILRAGAHRQLPLPSLRLLLAQLLQLLPSAADLAAWRAGGEATPPLLLTTQLAAVSDLLVRLGELTSEQAALAEPPLRRLLAAADAGVRSAAALALRELVLAHPPMASPLLEAGLAGLRTGDAAATDGPAADALRGHGALCEAVLAAAPGLPLGLPSQQPAACLTQAMALLSARSPAAKQAGWTLLAAALAGPGGPSVAVSQGETLRALWDIAFAGPTLLAPPRGGRPAEMRLRGAPAAAELAWRAAAAEALEALLRTATTIGPRAAGATSAQLGNTLRSALSLAGEKALEDASLGGAGLLLRLRLLQALTVLPDASLYACAHLELAGCCLGCLDGGAAPARSLLLSLLHPADAGLGPVAPGADSLHDALRVFQGGLDAPPPKLWLWLPPDGSASSPIFPSPLPLAAALAAAQADQLGALVAAAAGEERCVNMLSQLVSHCRAGYGASRESAARAASGRSSQLVTEDAAGGSAQATNAAAAALAALARAPSRVLPAVAEQLQELSQTLLADPAPGAALVRAAAQLGAAASRHLPGGAESACLEALQALREPAGSAAQRSAAALCLGVLFRGQGGLSLAAHLQPVTEALSAAASAFRPDDKERRGAAQTPLGGAPAFVWAAHALVLVAAESGAALARHAPAMLSLAHELLSCEDAAAAPQLCAAAGRLVNASVDALGPELQVEPAGSLTLRHCSALLQHASSCAADDPSAAMQEIIFLQACALYAPRSIPVAVAAPRLRAALRSRQAPLRAAAAAVVHNLADTRVEAVLLESFEAPLLGLADFPGLDPVALADARGALEALLRVDAPAQPVRWLRLAAAIATADGGGARAAAAAAAGDDMEEDEPPQKPTAGVPAAASIRLPPVAAASVLLSPAELPSWRTRAWAAELLARVPDAVGSAREHADLEAARAGPSGNWLVAQLGVAVELGFRLATGASASLRPYGLLLLRRLVTGWGAALDPDVGEGVLLMEQHVAQLLSALRAALGVSAAPPAAAMGAALAAEMLACGLAQRDAAVTQRLLSLLSGVTTSWGPPMAPSHDSLASAAQYGEWSAAFTKAAILAAHARAAASPHGQACASLRGAQAKCAAELATCWLQLLHDFAFAAGLPPPPGAAAAAAAAPVLSILDVPLSQQAVARAHLAAAWRPVLAACCAGGYPADDPDACPADATVPVPLSPDDLRLLLQIATWSLSREAAQWEKASSRGLATAPGGPPSVWALSRAATQVAGQQPAAAGCEALMVLLDPRLLAGCSPGELRAHLAVTLTTVAAAAVQRGSATQAAAPALLLRAAETLPQEEDGADDDPAAAAAAAELLTAAKAIASAALERAADEDADASVLISASDGLAGLAALLWRLPTASSACQLHEDALETALSALALPATGDEGGEGESLGNAALELLAAAAGGCNSSEALDAAAELVSEAVTELAEQEEAAGHLARLCSSLACLGGAPAARTAVRRRCRDTLGVLLDPEAGCSWPAQLAALAALHRALAEGGGSKWATGLFSALKASVATSVETALDWSEGEPSLEAVAAAMEGLRALAAGLKLRSEDKTALLATLVPLLIAAAAPEGGARATPALQSVAVETMSACAGDSPEPFKAVVSALDADTRSRLQGVLARAGGGGGAKSRKS